MDKSTKIKVAGCAVIICIVIFVLSVAMVKKYTPSDSMMALNEYYTVADTEAIVILENTMQEERAVLEGNSIYLSLSGVMGMLNTDFYFDEAEESLLLALPNELIQVHEGEAAFLRNEEREEFSETILHKIGQEYYLSTGFIERYSNVEFEFYEDPNRLIVHYQWVDFLYFDTTAEAALRVSPDIKSDILVRLGPEERLYYIGGTGTAGKSFIKVMTQDGIFGYVQRKYLSESYYRAQESSFQCPEYTHITMEDKVRLGWHMVTVPKANEKLSSILEGTDGMNVISPTWYRLSDDNGGITSLADVAYVEQAHQHGLQVWALVDDFDKEVSTYRVLSSTRARQRLIDNLITEAEQYSLDGINIDFEGISADSGVHFIQFLKELSIQCRNRGLVLSVDNYVPASGRDYYDLKTQGEIVDYVIIMAYDEHYSRSPEAGSVASLHFVKNALNNTISKVPRERILMGIPFYTRLWKETIENGEWKLSSEVLNMAGAESVLVMNDVKPSWDDKTGQNYVEFEKNGAVYKLWMEDEASLTEKLKIISGGNVAGVAAWRLGFEESGIWPLITFFLP